MEVNSVNNPTSNADLSGVAKNKMDKNAFLKLLVTQLRYQDPMSPMEDKEFVSQLAQFSQLEQMQELNTGFESYGKSTLANQAFSMTGKWVDYVDVITGTTKTGKVGSVSFVDGAPKLVIGDDLVDLTNVKDVYPDTSSLGRSKLTTQAFGTIGKTIEYYDTETGGIMSGKVDSVSFVDGWPALNIGSKVVDARNAINMQDISGSTGSSEAIDQAIAMSGHKISYIDPNTKEVVEGHVDSVTVDQNLPWLHVGQTILEPSQVVKVF